MNHGVEFRGLPGRAPRGFPSNRDIVKGLKRLLNLFTGLESLDGPLLLSYSLVDDQEMEVLNHQYRGKEGTTDVLSFSQVEGPEFPEAGLRALGDIVISRPQCIKQAEEKGHDPEQELWILTVHGLYHLLGYDHETSEEDAEHMEALERKLLAEFLKHS